MTKHIYDEDDAAFWTELNTSLNKSKTEHIRSTTFLMQAWRPLHQDAKFLFTGPIGPREPSGLDLQSFVKKNEMCAVRLFTIFLNTYNPTSTKLGQFQKWISYYGFLHTVGI